MNCLTSDEHKAVTGWYKDKAYTQPVDVSQYKVTKDETLYAKWVMPMLSEFMQAVASITKMGSRPRHIYLVFYRILTCQQEVG